MLALPLPAVTDRALRVLCLGAHADDIEIGCGGTLLTLGTAARDVDWTWVVWSGTEARRTEASAAAEAIIQPGHGRRILLETFRDGYFPADWGGIKDRFEALAREAPSPDVIFTHRRDDRHQDHRVVAELTWNTWRDHLILEYEVAKYEGDLGQPNVYVPLTAEVADQKVEVVETAFGSQRSRPWFNADTFRALMRLRGVECRSRSGYAEAFHGPKVVLGTP